MKTVRWRNTALQQGWTMVPNAVLDAPISPGAFRLWVALADYARQDESCFPGQQGLAARLKVSARTIRTWLTELVDVDLLENIQRGLGRTNEYVLTLPDDPCSEAENLPVRKQAAEPTHVLQDALEEEKTLAADKQPRKRDPIWDALVAVTGFDPKTTSEKSDFGKTVRELRAIIPAEATAQEVEKSMRARRRAWEREYPDAAFTHRVLRGKWSELEALARRLLSPADQRGEELPGEMSPEEFRQWRRTASGDQIRAYQHRYDVDDNGESLADGF